VRGKGLRQPRFPLSSRSSLAAHPLTFSGLCPSLLDVGHRERPAKDGRGANQCSSATFPQQRVRLQILFAHWVGLPQSSQR